MFRKTIMRLARAFAAAALTSAFLIGGTACAGPEPVGPTPTPTPDAQATIQDACANLDGHIPYDITYTGSFQYPGGMTVAIEYDVRINERGDYHASITQTLADAQGADSAGASGEVLFESGEVLFIGDSAYTREWPDGAWEEAMVAGTGDVWGVCWRERAGSDQETTGYVEQYEAYPGITATKSYADLGSTTLNGVEARHIRLSTRFDRYEYARDSGALEPSGGDPNEWIEELVDEFWVTPTGQIAQHRIMDTAGGITDLLGVVSGVGEPNIIEAPVLPTPAP